MADDRTYIKVHDGMPDHPKIDGLSDKAFRLLVETWCWCSRHRTDGRVPIAAWSKRGTAKARAELVNAGLVHTRSGSVEMHDYLEHQRSAAQIAERVDAKRRAASVANHNRWHLRPGKHDPNCPLCIVDPSQPRSQVRSHEPSQDGRTTSPDTETETEKNSAPNGAAAGASPDTAQALLGEWLDRCAKRPPGRVVGQVASQVKAMLGEGIEPDDIRRGLSAWMTKGLHPSTLPSVVNEVMNRAPPSAAARASTTDQRTAAAQALKSQFRDHPSNQRQLPAGGDR